MKSKLNKSEHVGGWGPVQRGQGGTKALAQGVWDPVQGPTVNRQT